MNLQREPLAGIEKLDKQRKTSRLPTISTQKLRSMGGNLLAQRLAFVGTVRDYGLDVVAVADFPGFPDALAKGDRLAVARERRSTPNAFDEGRGKFVWIEHLCALQFVRM